MATTVDKATFEAALAACYDAIEAEAWTTAYKEYAKAAVMLSGLEHRAGGAGTYYEMKQDLKSLKSALDAVRDVTKSGSDNNRMLRTRTGFAGSGP